VKRFQIGKIREYYLSILGGLLSGMSIAIGFSTSELDPNPNPNLFYQLVAIFGTIIILWLMYKLGIFIVEILKKTEGLSKGGIFGFKLNFIAGTISSIFIGFLFMFKDHKLIVLVVGIIITVISVLLLQRIRRE